MEIRGIVRAWVAMCVLLGATVVPIRGQDTADFDRLLNAWQLTPAGSAREAAVEDSIRSFVADLMPAEALEAYREYLLAPAGDTAESAALARAEAASPGNVRWPRAQTLLEAYFSFDEDFVEAFEAVHGTLDGARELGVSVGMSRAAEGPAVDVDLVLESSRERATAGDHFGVVATITNRSDDPIWIVDRYATLLPPPEIWGETQATSVDAFFPSMRRVATDDIIRIDAGRSYPVMWHIDPIGRSPERESIVQRTLDFLQFTPGEYHFSGIVHVWTKPPILAGSTVGDLSGSQVVMGSADIEVALPILILLVGGALGGVFGFMLRALVQAQRGGAPEGGWRIFVVREAVMAVLVAMVGTVLVSRLASMSGFVSLSINDVWGAAATGIVLQWIGVGVLIDRVRRDTGRGAPSAETGEQGAPATA